MAKSTRMEAFGAVISTFSNLDFDTPALMSTCPKDWLSALIYNLEAEILENTILDLLVKLLLHRREFSRFCVDYLDDGLTNKRGDSMTPKKMFHFQSVRPEHHACGNGLTKKFAINNKNEESSCLGEIKVFEGEGVQ